MTKPTTNDDPASGRKAYRLRIIVGESQRHEHLPLHEWLARRALELELAGATVYRSEMGYGATSRTKDNAIGALSADASMIVETVDSRDRLVDFLKSIEAVHALRKGIATLEPVELMVYRAG